MAKPKTGVWCDGMRPHRSSKSPMETGSEGSSKLMATDPSCWSFAHSCVHEVGRVSSNDVLVQMAVVHLARQRAVAFD